MIRYSPSLATLVSEIASLNFADLVQLSGLAYSLVPIHEFRFFLLDPAYQFRQGLNRQAVHLNLAPGVHVPSNF